VGRLPIPSSLPLCYAKINRLGRGGIINYKEVMAMANEESSTPEWDLFKRLEGLESTSTVTKPAIHDALVLAKMALALTFVNRTVRFPRGARKLKDDIIGLAKRAGVSQESLEGVEVLLSPICEIAEQREQ